MYGIKKNIDKFGLHKSQKDIDRICLHENLKGRYSLGLPKSQKIDIDSAKSDLFFQWYTPLHDNAVGKFLASTDWVYNLMCIKICKMIRKSLIQTSGLIYWDFGKHYLG